MKHTKKLASLLLALALAFALAVPAFAVDESRKFEFSLSVDGKTEKYVSTGDVISVTFTLKRTDADEEYAMYAMQNEILYDSTFFELVEGSAMVSNGIRTTDIAMRDNDRAFYMNFSLPLTRTVRNGKPKLWSGLSS